MKETKPLPLLCSVIIYCDRCSYKTEKETRLEDALYAIGNHSMIEHRYETNNTYPIDVRNKRGLKQ